MVHHRLDVRVRPSTRGRGASPRGASRRDGTPAGRARRLDGDDVLVVALDVTRQDGIEPVLAAALERFGRIDVLVNNAGIGFVGALEEMSLDDLRRAMETMFFGPAALTRAVIPQMRAQGSGT